MIELRMNISINDGEFIKSYDKTIQNRQEYYEIDLSEYSIDTILRLQVVNKLYKKV
jgi:CMP-N-acetylneuraminic acid synthetase